mmetsp:Transcript_734/g.1536  ORF Transcript_734/g.1536 Transcript_734/m.1536 type:complete len:150 (-) Transcript_734:242-691(-)|eukprot:CAMPEP_0178427946 /NCGR_PEP_ID=MMETSP0689_2-20121128/30014_1 /TAXON_ID=160604 /ORGANISM="Amphidinium massartii, Strain CS-259" /LENGTH=149 /DNA_ID=CAMNT_0020049683 /DNA_START=62 /DNA_END=511 /DNA_ORIENTATION=+
MGRKAARESSSESEDRKPRGKEKKREKDTKDAKAGRKEKRSRSRGGGGGAKARRGRSASKSEPRRRGRSESSSSGRSSDDEEDMKEFLLSTDMPEDQMMVKMMGFSAFDSTKGKDHSASDLGDVKRATKRQYRQYMNRRGGFNRPLDSG